MESMTPAEALRAIADNLDSGLAAMEGLEVQVADGRRVWRDPDDTEGCFLVRSLVIGVVKTRRKPVPTPAQKAGWKVGDIGRHKTGMIVALYEDNAGHAPLWRIISNNNIDIFNINSIERLIPESECK